MTYLEYSLRLNPNRSQNNVWIVDCLDIIALVRLIRTINNKIQCYLKTTTNDIPFLPLLKISVSKMLLTVKQNGLNKV